MAELGVTGAAVVAAGWAGRKLLGPLFDEIAVDLKDRYSTFRANNIRRIGAAAQQKLRDRLDEPGGVPPRIAVRILDDGSWSDSDVVIEYYAGILASSRSPESNDEGGAYWAALIGRLPSHALHVHYLIYDAFRRQYAGRYFDVGLAAHLLKMRMYVPCLSFLEPMNGSSADQIADLVADAMLILRRERLINERCSWDERRWGWPSRWRKEAAILVRPSNDGALLFMLAHGIPNPQYGEFFFFSYPPTVHPLGRLAVVKDWYHVRNGLRIWRRVVSK